MDIFDFEELTAEMLGVTDEQREDDSYLPDKFYEEFDIDFELAHEFACRLILHTVPVEAGLTKRAFHAFVSRKEPVMLMKIEAKAKTTDKQGEHNENHTRMLAGAD